MLSLAVPVWHIVVRSAVIYFTVLVGLRLLGKRELGQMTVFDLVVILLIANAVQNAMVGPDVSLLGGMISAVVLLVINRIVAALGLHGEGWGRLLEGTPRVLIQDGRLFAPNMVKEGLTQEQVEMAIREHGFESIGDVKLGVLETDGTISIVPKDASIIRTRRHIRQIARH